MAKEDALRLLSHFREPKPREVELPLAEELVRIVGGHTLALSLLGYRLNRSSGGYSEVLRSIEEAGMIERIEQLADWARSKLALGTAARGMLAQKNSRVIDALGAIAVPTLVIVGDKDEPFIAPCEYMAKKIPGARLEVIRDAGHSSNLDQPDAFNRVFVEFLDSL